jgi:hypothetical protein
MKRLLASFVILICAAVVLGQTAPATKPATKRGYLGDLLPVVRVPDIEAFIATVPADLWAGLKSTDNTQIKAYADHMTAWTKDHANGKPLDISAVQYLLKPRGSEKEAKFVSPSGKEVDLVIFTGGKGAPKVTVFSVGFGGAPAQGHPVLFLNVK